MIRLAPLLLVLPLVGLWLKVADPAGPDFDRAAGIALAERMLEANGLVQDPTSHIAISGERAAVVFTPPACVGAVVLVPLPPTAQRFETVVAGLDEALAAEGFVHRGERLGHAFHLPGSARSAWSTTVFAYRELGPCGLLPTLDWSLTRSKESMT